ncbi:MAG: SUMF1/EgtB/PvdO family nonheme iron enzyme, partial [Bacteriovoracales bacterium]|nr:SUMF1/EgtB/PvdO family nonheme iron enzyme [Bacteriovoracales bacterium]
LIIDGRRFHDVIGNVWEWGWDEWSDKLPEGKNPVNASSSYREGYHIIHGGSWYNDARFLRSAYRFYEGLYRRSINVGLRLVRTIRNP